MGIFKPRRAARLESTPLSSKHKRIGGLAPNHQIFYLMEQDDDVRKRRNGGERAEERDLKNSNPTTLVFPHEFRENVLSVNDER